MVVNDRPDEALDFDIAERISKMPEGPERTAALQKVQADSTFGRQRLYVGKNSTRTSEVMVNDQKGRPRIIMKQAHERHTSIELTADMSGGIRPHIHITKSTSERSR